MEGKGWKLNTKFLSSIVITINQNNLNIEYGIDTIMAMVWAQ